MGNTILRFAAAMMAVGVGTLACGAGPSEAVGSTIQRLVPDYFDLPHEGQYVVDTGYRAPGTGSPEKGQVVGFCFFTRIRGQMRGVPMPEYDSKDTHPADDAYTTILPEPDVFIGRLRSGFGMQVTFGCVPLAAFDNAGLMQDESGYEVDEIYKTGDGFPSTSGTIPGSSSRTPSFCTLNGVKGNFYHPYANCTNTAYIDVDTNASSSRTSDAAELTAKGSTCAAVNNWPFGETHDLYESTQRAWAGCGTRWNEQPGTYHLVKFGPANVASSSTANGGWGTQLMLVTDGVCWISNVTGTSLGEYEEVGVFQHGSPAYWYVHSDTDGAGKATCMYRDQQQ